MAKPTGSFLISAKNTNSGMTNGFNLFAMTLISASVIGTKPQFSAQALL